MNFKEGVILNGVKPPILRAMAIAEEVMGPDTTVTSVMDGKHSEKSLHYVGMAMDLRTWGLTRNQVGETAHALQVRLNKDYDVVVESDHLHIEFDPK